MTQVDWDFELEHFKREIFRGALTIEIIKREFRSGGDRPNTGSSTTIKYEPIFVINFDIYDQQNENKNEDKIIIETNQIEKLWKNKLKYSNEMNWEEFRLYTLLPR